MATLLAVSHGFQRRLIKQENQHSRVFTDVSLRRLNGTVTAIIHSWPGPAWIKAASTENGTTVFRMMELNGAYEKVCGISRINHIGKTDLEAGWDHERAEEFRRHDLMVWASGESEVVTEPRLGADDKVETFIKIRLTSQDGQVKGIMGLSMSGVRAYSCGRGDGIG